MQITIYRDSLGLTKPTTTHHLNGTLLDALIAEFGPDGSPLPFACVVNGEVLPETYDALNKRYESVQVLINPGADPTTWLLVASIALSVATYVLVKPPVIDPNADSGFGNIAKSPNNDLAEQTNRARPKQRIPDIFGEVRAYPDLITRPSFRYGGNIKKQTHVFCVGMGAYNLSQFKLGDTLIDGVKDAEYEVYEPFQSIPNLESVIPSTSVENILVAPVNENVVDFSGRATDLRADIEPGNAARGRFFDSGPDGTSFSFVSAGDQVRVINSEFQITFGGVPTQISLDGLYTVAEANGREIYIDSPQSTNSDWFFMSTNTEFNSEANTVIEASNSSDIGPFRAPSSSGQFVEVDLIAPRGIAQGDFLNESFTVEIALTLIERDVNTNAALRTRTFNLDLIGSSREERFYTYRYPVIAGRNVELQLERLTPTINTAQVVDEIRCTRFASVKQIDGADPYGTTRIRLIVRANEQTIEIDDRKFNCIAKRKGLTYDPINLVQGSLSNHSNLTASTRFADAFLTYFGSAHLGNLNISQLDVAGLYQIQDELDAVFNGQLGQFSWTFDGSASPEEELSIIAQAARCYVIKTGNNYSVHREQSQPFDKMLISLAHKQYPETRSLRLNKPADNDGVELSYYDFASDEYLTITLPDDLPAGDPNADLPSTLNPLKMELKGCTNRQQAWNRAQYELNKLIYQRVTVQSTISPLAGVIDINDRVASHDFTRPREIAEGLSSGLIVGVVQPVYYTNERILFAGSNIEHRVYFTDEFGGIDGPHIIEQVQGDEFAFAIPGSVPTITMRPLGSSGSDQRPTTYFIESNAASRESLLLQRKRVNTDYTFDCEFINYDERYFQADNQGAP